MIRRISGTILEQNLGTLIVDVGGVGYEVRIALNAAIDSREGDAVSLFTHHAVRENSVNLYGFPTQKELGMFELLIELPGIGPKSALNIMSQADVRLLEDAARSGDANHLSKLSGIGKKSAEKIIAGLKDKIGESVAEGGFSGEDGDVIDALLALGYSQDEARRALRSLEKGRGTTRERLKEALRFLGTK